MKLFKKALSGVAVAVALAASAPVYASTVAAADLDIFALGLVGLSGAPFTGFTIVSESRTGTADATYNGVQAVQNGPGSIVGTGVGVTVNVLNRCAGNCVAGYALYGGPAAAENNGTFHRTGPGTVNYALGDMNISGSSLGIIDGLTRADAETAGPPNIGGSNSTIKNAGSIFASFTVPTTFTGNVSVTADWFLRAYVDSVFPTSGTSDAGFGWNMVVTSSDDSLFTKLSFAPNDLNQSFFSTKFLQNQLAQDNNTAGGRGQTYLSDTRTFSSGKTYNFSINQSSNAAVSENQIPEPASLALVGLGLLGLVTSRRRKQV